MLVSDGFILGIYNYCDRWCEACAFTSRCRTFVDVAKAAAATDPDLKPVVDAPLRPEDEPPPIPRWMEELIDAMNAAADAPDPGDETPCPPPPPADHERLRARAQAYCDRAYAWLGAHARAERRDVTDPLSVVDRLHLLIFVKIARAVGGLAFEHEDEAGEEPRDSDGSAKVALLALERSAAAWRQLFERGVASSDEAEAFAADIRWLIGAVEHTFPRARAFVRPGFDEPDAVARMLAAEAGVRPG